MQKAPEAVDLRQAPRRPFGVYVLTLLMLLAILNASLEIIRVRTGLSGFWAGFDEFFRSRTGLVAMIDHFIDDPTLIQIADGIVIAIWVAIIIGLWLLQRWAWLALMILTGVSLTFSLVRYFEGQPNYLGMLINVVIAFYLNDRSVQRAYARHKPEMTA